MILLYKVHASYVHVCEKRDIFAIDFFADVLGCRGKWLNVLMRLSHPTVTLSRWSLLVHVRSSDY